jgi:hypothetical protein
VWVPVNPCVSFVGFPYASSSLHPSSLLCVCVCVKTKRNTHTHTHTHTHTLTVCARRTKALFVCHKGCVVCGAVSHGQDLTVNGWQRYIGGFAVVGKWLQNNNNVCVCVFVCEYGKHIRQLIGKEKKRRRSLRCTGN